MERTAVRLRITGRVQGVGYRYWMRAAARARGLVGWVRNEPSGTVSAHVEGPREAVEALIEECRTGPAPAEVSAVHRTDAAPSDAFDTFRVTI